MGIKRCKPSSDALRELKLEKLGDMLKVKIYGAGSIGNHLSNAARQCGWSVDLCDVDPKALKRTRDQIYPSRYGAWDEGIGLYENDNAPRGGYDLIFVGTPPDSHVALALDAIKEQPRAILVEKPFCTPRLEKAKSLHEAATKAGVSVFVGYDHVVGEAAEKLTDIINSNEIGEIDTIDVEFREHWGGIFAAHPWLSGPSDSYLGDWERGGGASGEHSHAINLWQHLAMALGAGRVVAVQATMNFVKESGCVYDNICLLQLKTESGLVGRVVQDVVTSPPRKWARIQGKDGYLEWQCGYAAGVDAVFHGSISDDRREFLFAKTRPDDFIRELRHIESVISGADRLSPISIDRGLDTMLVVSAAHKSVVENKTIGIDYSKGYTNDALLS